MPSMIVTKILFQGALLAGLVSVTPACRDHSAIRHEPTSLKKGNATLQLDAHLLESGDISVSVTSLLDLPYLDLKTKLGNDWRELTRLTDLKANLTRTVIISGPLNDTQFIWAMSDAGGPRWVGQTRILPMDPSASASFASKALGIKSPGESHPTKLRPEFSGKKIME
jgi:hypothetical protein